MSEEFAKLIEENEVVVPQAGDIVKGVVVTASKAEVKLDIDGVLMGVVRGPELYNEADEYADLKPGEEVEATVIEEENENGELELSFRIAGQEKAWNNLREAYKDQKPIKVKVYDANKGGLLVRFRQIQGFLPVSQLAPDNYPRVSGGDKGKILEKLKSFVGTEFKVKVMTLDEEEDKIIFSEKEVWNEEQQDVINQYKIGTVIEGTVTAVTDFGVFLSFGDSMEGLIHISELAWKRIDSPADLYKVGDKIKAEVINVDGAKIFLSAKKLAKDPWEEVGEKYKAGQIVKGKILKVNPFGLFVELDEFIHGLAHISQLGLASGQKIDDLYNSGEEIDFEVTSIEPKEHRLGLKVAKEDKKSAKAEKKEETVSDKKDEEKSEEKEEKEDKKKEKKTKKDEKKSEDKKSDTKKDSKDKKEEKE
ncbi:S1 RNA-binding domain-containing protein [Candidatus Falkowbacteria bacterium]|nr:S1 RNA-binding domain-containing protein [Candidatus Falkowbacteria bacterium]